MQVSFGQFIPVSVHCNQVTKGPRNSVEKTPYEKLETKDIPVIEKITDDFALKLSRREQNDEITEQQRRVFRANVPDYSLPAANMIPHENGKTSAVVGLTIGNNRYLVTGAKDVSFVESNLYRQVNPYLFERDVIRYINSNHSLSDKKMEIYASKMSEDNEEKYKVNLIDFYSAISSRPISGECAQ